MVDGGAIGPFTIVIGGSIGDRQHRRACANSRDCSGCRLRIGAVVIVEGEGVVMSGHSAGIVGHGKTTASGGGDGCARCTSCSRLQ